MSLVLNGQLTYEQPDSNLISRVNEQVEIASILINADVDFFQKALKNEENFSQLEIEVKDAKFLNVYFDELKLSQNSILKVYNENNQLEVVIQSNSNKNGGLYAIQPIKGSVLKFVFEGDQSNSKILIGEIGYFWKSFDEISSSGWCEVDINCSEGEEWKNQKNGVVRLLIKTNTSTVYCSGTLVNNTSRDCKPYILSADHCVDNVSPENLQQSLAYFNYENSSCGEDDATLNNFVLGMVLRASTSFYNGSDVLLLELQEEIPLEYNPYYNGWNKSNAIFSGGVCIHHPKGDVKKISTYTSNLTTADENGLTENAFWRVNWVETTNGHGVTEQGSSGSPIFNHEKLVVGVLSVGTSYCSRPEDSDYFGKISHPWDSQLDSNSRLDVWLDPTHTNEEFITGSYYPCNDTMVHYEPRDSMLVRLNPTQDRISLYIEQLISNSVEVFLYDTSGKLIFKKEEAPSNLTVIEFPTLNIRNGLYILHVYAGNKERTFKVTVVN
ncbi:MAG: hypothetical protein CMP67_04340 [Flavobacteriales bacterium]|nr:hypothetical protein [Flavobacteriales bacterium]MBO72514.1 hypothetical protein [Flavobacteriales bacterium]|tara:strand:- start:74906 stop:76396 length:1491 start_codon:yes stop_codon:yes gene_type:complete